MALGWRGSYARYREFFLNIAALYKKRADVRAFLEIILSLGTVIIFLVFALRPTAITIISLLQQINDKKQVLSALTQKVSNLQTAGNLLTQNQNALPDINIAVPSQPNPDTLAQQVEGLAIKNGAEILGITINNVIITGTTTTKSASNLKALPGGAKEMAFSVSVRGNYSSLASFVSDFQNLRIVSNIDSLAISSSVTDKGLVIVAVLSGRVPIFGT